MASKDRIRTGLTSLHVPMVTNFDLILIWLWSSIHVLEHPKENISPSSFSFIGLKRWKVQQVWPLFAFALILISSDCGHRYMFYIHLSAYQLPFSYKKKIFIILSIPALPVSGDCGNQIITKWAVCMRDACSQNYLQLQINGGVCERDHVCCFVRPKINLKVSSKRLNDSNT